MLTKVRCALNAPSQHLKGSMVPSNVVAGSTKTVSMRTGRRWVSALSSKHGISKVSRNIRSSVSGLCQYPACGSRCVSCSRVGSKLRAYATDAPSSGGADKKPGQSGSAAPGAAKGAAPKKVGGTSSTLSNLENLYAAFAKQQKEKAKTAEKSEVAQDASNRGVPLTSQREERGGSYKDSHLRAASEIEFGDDMDSTIPVSVWSSKVFGPQGSQTMAEAYRNNSQMPRLFPKGSLKRDEDVERLEKLAETSKRFSGDIFASEDRSDVDRFAKRAVEQSAAGEALDMPRTLEELREFEEAESIALGELDPTSPQALEMKRRHQKISPRSEQEARTIEQNLITRHRTAVEETTGHMIKELDLSASVEGMAPLTASQNPYLFNEGFSVGLTDSELQWLQTRSAWRNLVEAKRTNVALQQRDMKQERDLVDQLFINVVNRLSDGPASGSWIHPDDIKAQQEAFEARKRLQDRLWEIYHHEPTQWAALLHKYLPRPLEDRMAHHVMNREFWSPSNPWLLTAFTKQLVEEAQLMEKVVIQDPLEDEIYARLIDQGSLRLDDASDELAIGPLGQTIHNNGADLAAEGEKTQEGFSGCLFCSEHRHRFPLDPMNVPLLARHMNASGQILPRTATGLCKRHQAKLARTIKHARHLNLFTHKKSIYRINNVFKTPADWNTPDLDNQVYTNPLTAKSVNASEEEIEERLEEINRTADINFNDYDSAAPNLYRHQSAELQEDLLDQEREDMAFEDMLEELTAPALSGVDMSSIETLAHHVHGSNQRYTESDQAAEVERAKARAKSADDRQRYSRRAAASAVQTEESTTDEIGDSMVRAALSKAKGTNFRRKKDSL